MTARAHTLYALTVVAGAFLAGGALGGATNMPQAERASVVPRVAGPAPKSHTLPILRVQSGSVAQPVQARQAFSFAENLDGLFDQLARTGDKGLGERIAERIWDNWRTSDSRSIDLLAHWARGAMAQRNFSAALDLLDQVVVLRPDFAEGWNTRATLHFMMENYGKSVRDIERTLTLEPRHFGALSGLANIFERYGRKREALQVWYRVLAIYPSMQPAQAAVQRLEEDLAGEAI